MSWKWHSQRAASLGVRPVQLDKHSATRQKHRVWWPDENAVALLIDADHMPAQSIGLFQSLAERLGSLSVQWVYGNWPEGNLKPWQQILSSHRLEKRECGPVAYGKNAADITLTRDIMLLYAEGIRKFVLVASDSDYTPLVSWLCTQGCLVVVLGKANTPCALQQAASAFHLLEHLVLPERLVPVYERPHAERTIVPSQADRAIKLASASGETIRVPMDDSPLRVERWVLERLTVYEPAPYSWVLVPGLYDHLRADFRFRPKDHGHKHLFALLQAFPKMFELRPSQEHALRHEVRRVQE